VKIKNIGILLFALTFFGPSAVRADTVYFNNGGTIDGIIRKEDANSVDLDIGFGTITCGKKEINKIERSTPDEVKALEEKWERKRKDLKNSEAEFAIERQKRFAEYDRWTREEREKAAKEASSQGTIDLARDADTHSILVETVLNDKTHATLVLDTGASIVVLTRRKGEELGLDLTDTKNSLATLQLAGDRKVLAKMVILKSVRIKDIEVKDVLAGVLLDEAGMGLKDGLLGMTFLNRFNLKIDLKNMKMALEKTG
jgi:clan AA aspartic protease (TIGR02281 family)